MRIKIITTLLLIILLLTGCQIKTEGVEPVEETDPVKESEVSGELETAKITETGEIQAEEPAHLPPAQIVDLMIFAGQSNMAGNGDYTLAPKVPEGYGYEFRAISDPSQLYPVESPFGLEENVEGGIYDIWSDSGIRRKLGGLVPAFINGYYEETGVPVVGVSASEGGTRVEQWKPESSRYEDMKKRTLDAKAYLEQDEEYELRNTYLIWCQGESDGDAGMSEDAYSQALEQIVTALVSEDVIDACMIVRIGNFGTHPEKYDKIIAAQTRICKENEYAVLVSTRFAEMADTGMMCDVYHYTQEGYNLVGEEAGKNCGKYANTGREPKLWDYESGREYDPYVEMAE